MATPIEAGAPRAAARREARRRRRPDETVENWLIRNGQTARLREMLWDPLALAALNQPPDRRLGAARSRACSARCSATIRKAAAIALPTKPLASDVRRAGARATSTVTAGRCAPESTATLRLESDATVGVTAGGDRWSAKQVISRRAVVCACRICSTIVPAPLTDVVDRARG